MVYAIVFLVISIFAALYLTAPCATFCSRLVSGRTARFENQRYSRWERRSLSGRLFLSEKRVRLD